MEEVIDLRELFIYFWNRRKIILYSVLGIVVFLNIVFFAFKGFVYSNIGTIEAPIDSTVEKIASYSDFLLSDYVIDNAIANSNVKIDRLYVKKNLNLYNNIGSRVYTINLKYKDKIDGRNLCRAIINEFASKIESFEGNYVRINNTIETSSGPINFNVIKSELSYFIIGCLLVFGYFFVIYFFDKKIKSKNELSGLNVLGTIDNNKNNISLIKTKITISNQGNVVLLSTPKNINCKKDILLLIKEFSKDLKVLLIDTNIRNRKSKSLGYFNVLRDHEEDISHYIKKGKFDIMECGTISSEVEILLSSKNNKKLLKELKKKYDYVILYNSDVVDYSDALILSKLCDCNYMVVGINQTDKCDFQKSIEMYKQVNTKIDGIIIIDKE